MKSNLRKTIISLFLVVILCSINFSPAFASGGVYYVGAWYTVGVFSFTDDCITTTKTVMGRYVDIDIDFHKPYWDEGLGDIYLTWAIIDPYTGNPIAGNYVMGPTGTTVVGQTYYHIDLGYAGRQVEFWFDASSAGPSNGNFRSATVDYFGLFTYN